MLYMIYRPKHTVTSAPKLLLVFMTEPLLFFKHKASNLFYITYFIIFSYYFKSDHHLEVVASFQSEIVKVRGVDVCVHYQQQPLTICIEGFPQPLGWATLESMQKWLL